jgi:hypothetical protein
MLLDAPLSSASSAPTSPQVSSWHGYSKLHFDKRGVGQSPRIVVGKGISDNVFYITSLQRRASFGSVYLFSESVIVSP